jgi:hypothetical protein
VYFIGPAVGAILGVIVYDFISRTEPQRVETPAVRQPEHA